MLCLLLFTGAVGIMSAFVRSIVVHERLHCGNTTDEAVALRCEFDLLSNSWTPKECFDAETSTEFRQWLLSPERYRQWPYFSDENATQWISNEEILSQRINNVIWTTPEHHIGHCIFLLRRLHRIVEARGTIRMNSRFGQYSHTEHCSNVTLRSLMNPSNLTETSVRLVVSLESC